MPGKSAEQTKHDINRNSAATFILRLRRGDDDEN